jgi:hypothetical protein
MSSQPSQYKKEESPPSEVPPEVDAELRARFQITDEMLRSRRRLARLFSTEGNNVPFYVWLFPLGFFSWVMLSMNEHLLMKLLVGAFAALFAGSIAFGVFLVVVYLPVSSIINTTTAVGKYESARAAYLERVREEFRQEDRRVKHEEWDFINSRRKDVEEAISTLGRVAAERSGQLIPLRSVKQSPEELREWVVRWLRLSENGTSHEHQEKARKWASGALYHIAMMEPDDLCEVEEAYSLNTALGEPLAKLGDLGIEVSELITAVARTHVALVQIAETRCGMSIAHAVPNALGRFTQWSTDAGLQ